MDNLRELITTRDRRMWLLLAILLVGLVLSGYKILDAIFGDHSSPEYVSNPPTAFASHAPETLIDPAKVDEPRLPDEVYTSLRDAAADLTAKVGTFKATAGDLRAAGMDAAAARSAVMNLKGLHSQVTGATGRYSPPQIVNIAGAAVTLNSQLTYQIGAAAPLTATLRAEYVVGGTDFRLQHLAVEIGAVSAGATTP